MVLAPMFMFSPSCNCCEICSYSASDGSEYAETFGGTLNGGWTHSLSTWYTSGGRVRADTGSSPSGNGIGLYRSMSGGLTISGVILIQQAKIYRLDSNTTLSAIFVNRYFGHGGSGNQFYLEAKWGSTTWACRAGGAGVINFTATAPSDGDTISQIAIEHGGGQFTMCYYLNTSLIHSELAAGGFDATPTHGLGMFCTGCSAGTTLGEFDDYTIEINRGP